MRHPKSNFHKKCKCVEKHLQGAGASQNFQKVASGHWCDWFLIPGSELYGFSKKSNSRKSTKVLNFKHFWKN